MYANQTNLIAKIMIITRILWLVLCVFIAYTAVIPTAATSATVISDAILRTSASTSSSISKRQITFQRFRPSGSSAWRSLFRPAPSTPKCPQGYFLRLNKCQSAFVTSGKCGSGFIFQNGVCVCPKGSIILDGKCIFSAASTTSLFTSKESFGNRRLLAALDPMRNFVFPWYGENPQGSDLTTQPATESSQLLSDEGETNCYVKSYDFSTPSEELLNIASNTDVLFPGSFVQSRYVRNGVESLVSLPIGQDKRHLIRLASAQGNFQPFDVDPLPGQMNVAIRQSLANSTGFSSGTVFYDLTTSSQMQQLVINFNFNTKILEKIDVRGGFSGDWKSTKNKYILTMVQKINSYFAQPLVRDAGELADAFGIFIRQGFDDDSYAMSLKSQGYWGPKNPPLYISEVFYGRMLVVSVDQNNYTKNIYAQISASNNQSAANLSVSFTKLFQDSSTKVFSIGPFDEVQVNALKSGQWESFFKEIPADRPMLQALKPVGWRLKDWKLRPIKVSNVLQYNTIACEPKKPKRIQIRLFDVYKTVSGLIRRPGDSGFSSLSSIYQGSSLNDITGDLAPGDNQIIIHSQVDKPGFFKSYQRKMNMEVLVDGIVVWKTDPAVECTTCHSSGTSQDPNPAVYCQRINKYTGAVVCKQNKPK